MLKQKQEQIATIVRIGDVLVSILAFFAAYAWRNSSAPVEKYGPLTEEPLYWLLMASLVLRFVIYNFFGFYESLRLKSIPSLISMVVRAYLTELMFLGAVVFFLQAKDTSRYFFVLFLSLNYAFVLIERLGARIVLTSIRKRGYNFRQILIVGIGRSASRVVEALTLNRQWGFVPFGLLAPKNHKLEVLPQSLYGLPVLGTMDKIEGLVKSRAVDEVYFALDYFDSEEVEEAAQLCERLGIAARFSFGMLDLRRSKVTLANLQQVPILTFHTALRTPLEEFFKRAMDIAIALVGLAMTAFLYPWIASRIRRQSPGPVIFKQVRVGENGRRFKLYKFRTMSLDAESQKSELEAKNEMQGPMFKLAQDPRVFEFGRFLRRTSLDELPQFLNILRGDMSVVGTRPPTPDEVAKYEIHFRRRLSIRPGLTGLWQVSGRNEVSKFEDVLELDLKYIDTWSLGLDLRIIAKTLFVAFFRRRGAH